MRGWSFWLIVLASSASSGAAPVPLDVRVCLRTGISADELKSAETVAGLVLNEAGMDVRWPVCNEPEDDESGQRIAMLFVILGSSPRPGGVRREAGAAFLDHNGTGMYGQLYYDEVREFAQKENICADRVLAYVIAHEIGHLAGLKHGAVGVMRQNWTQRDVARMKMHWLYFTALEADRMTASLQARVQGLMFQVRR